MKETNNEKFNHHKEKKFRFSFSMVQSSINNLAAGLNSNANIEESSD